MKRYVDTETCGLHGMPVLLQHATDEGPISLYEIWRNPIRDTLQLIESICGDTVVGFNLSFDWFQLVKCYTTFRLCPSDWIPIEHVNEIALKEPEAQDGPCLKPFSALDLMLHARKGPLQSLMARNDIRIKRVPTALAYALADELERRVEIDQIYFAKRSDQEAPHWQVSDRNDRFGDLDKNFKDVILRFAPAGGLKFIAEHVLHLKPKFHYTDVEPDPSWRPYELGFAPTALAVSSAARGWEVWGSKKNAPTVEEYDPDPDEIITHDKKDKLLGIAWPGVIHKFVEHWANNANAREYANDDIVYTRALDHYFGNPEPGDNDSILACAVAAVRWRGFVVDIDGMATLRDAVQHILNASPVNVNKPTEVRAYITAMMNETEQLILSAQEKSTIIDSTKKNNLEAIAHWTVQEEEVCCESGCPRCHGEGVLHPGQHPAAVRSQEVLDVKSAAKEKELYDKLLLAGKLHASFNVIGALSSRMSGTDGLNVMGVKNTTNVRQLFPLAGEGEVLSIGDFVSCEVSIAEAVCNDPGLHKDMTQSIPCPACGATGVKEGEVCDECAGTKETVKKLHALFAQALWPGMTYEAVLATKGTEDDRYKKGKIGVFAALLYGGNENTLETKIGVPAEQARKAIESFAEHYPGVKAWRERVTNDFGAMRQPGGIGTRVVWTDPKEWVESLFGFRRYFTLENRICRSLFDLANSPPKEWKDYLVKCVRRERVQTAGGAVQSALYAAAFNLQSGNVRAASNHMIQSSSAQITKDVQCKVWTLQPCGIHDWKIAQMQCHDEIATVTPPEMVEPVAAVLHEAVAVYVDRVPLLKIDWVKHAATWADK